MYCYECGGRIPNNAKFCYYCGKKLQDDVKDEVPKIIKKVPKDFFLPSIFRLNAYHVLGLNTASDQKQIQKHGKEIINRIKIEDLPEYDLDIDPASKFRTEETVKTAVQNLLSPKHSLKEFFFWFDLGNEQPNQQLTDAIRSKNNNHVFSYWGDKPENHPETNWINLKNLAIYKTILIFNGNNKPYLTDSLDLWRKILNSDKFWEIFFNCYHLRLGFEGDNQTNNEFKKLIETFLSDIYVEISELNNDPDYLLEFKKRFSSKGGRLEKDLLTPIFENIQRAINELNSVKIAKDTDSNFKAIHSINKSISKIEDGINKITSFGLTDDSEVKTIRDQAANAIRSISIKINNELNDQDTAISLIKIAREISGTSSYKTSLGDDIKQLDELKTDDLILKPINEFIEKKRFSDALTFIENKERGNNNQKLIDLLIDRKKVCVTAFAIEKYNSAMTFFKSRNYLDSKSNFEQVAMLIYDNLPLFNFNKKTIDEMLNEIPLRINHALFNRSLESLDKFRDEIINLAKKSFEGQYEKDILIILIDSHVYPALIKKGVYTETTTQINNNQMQTISQAPTLYIINGIGTFLYGDTQYFVFLFIPIFPIARFSVERVGPNELFGKLEYRFFGKLELHAWQKIWQYTLVAIVGYFIIGYWIFGLLVLWFIFLLVQNKKIF